MSYINYWNIGKENPRRTLSTRLDKDLLDKFKEITKAQKMPMNILLETYFRQFIDGEIQIEDVNEKWYI